MARSDWAMLESREGRQATFGPARRAATARAPPARTPAASPDALLIRTFSAGSRGRPIHDLPAWI